MDSELESAFSDVALPRRTSLIKPSTRGLNPPSTSILVNSNKSPTRSFQARPSFASTQRVIDPDGPLSGQLFRNDYRGKRNATNNQLLQLVSSPGGIQQLQMLLQQATQQQAFTPRMSIPNPATGSAPGFPDTGLDAVCAIRAKKTGSGGNGLGGWPPLDGEGAVPNRATDTEVGLKLDGDLPMWYYQKKNSLLGKLLKTKYQPHMLNLFKTGICALVGKQHVYLLKCVGAREGDKPHHLRLYYVQALFVKLDGMGGTIGGTEQRFGRELRFYSNNQGEASLKTSSKAESHILIDHFFMQRFQPDACKCIEVKEPCSCFDDASKTIQENPAAFQHFTGSTGFKFQFSRPE